jgi:hypothetical protein
MRLVSRPVAIPGFHETCITVSSGHTLWYRLRAQTININKFLQKLAIGIHLVVIHKRLAAKLFDAVSRPPHTRWYLPQSQLQRYHGIRWGPWYCDLPRDKLILTMRPIPWDNAILVETCSVPLWGTREFIYMHAPIIRGPWPHKAEWVQNTNVILIINRMKTV